MGYILKEEPSHPRHTQKATCTVNFRVEIFTLAKCWKYPNCPILYWWLDILWYQYDAIHRRNGIFEVTNTWIMLIQRNLQIKHILIHKNTHKQKIHTLQFLHVFWQWLELFITIKNLILLLLVTTFLSFPSAVSEDHPLPLFSLYSISPLTLCNLASSPVFYWTYTVSNHHDFFLDKSLSLVKPVALKCLTPVLSLLLNHLNLPTSLCFFPNYG